MTIALFPGRLASGSNFWCEAKDGDLECFAIARRHYSAAKNPNPKIRQFVGPGEPLVLITPEADALFVWRKFIDDSGQSGVNCAIFRYERSSDDAPLASKLIRDAMTLAWRKWPQQRLYTYVDSKRIRSTNPGFCFKQAGWDYVRDTRGNPVHIKSRGLHILQYLMELEVAA